MCVGVPPSSASFLHKQLCKCINRKTQKGVEYKALQAQTIGIDMGCVYSATAAY